MHTHQCGPARACGPAVDGGQLTARARSGFVDFGASWAPCCCYFRTCLALPVPCGLQEIPTFVPPFAMCQSCCWSSGSSASCLCFCSTFFLWEVQNRSELENGVYAPPHREIYLRSP